MIFDIQIENRAYTTSRRVHLLVSYLRVRLADLDLSDMSVLHNATGTTINGGVFYAIEGHDNTGRRPALGHIYGTHLHHKRYHGTH